MNCWSNCPDGSEAAALPGGVEARIAWNSLMAGFGEVSPDWNSSQCRRCSVTILAVRQSRPKPLVT